MYLYNRTLYIRKKRLSVILYKWNSSIYPELRYRVRNSGKIYASVKGRQMIDTEVSTVLQNVPANTPATPKYVTSRMEITRFNTASAIALYRSFQNSPIDSLKISTARLIPLIKKLIHSIKTISFADLSYAEDKLFNMQCYICDAKYAFLEDIGYIYRKNDMSVSWQYRPDSVENWFKLVYELKSWIEKKDKDATERCVWIFPFRNDRKTAMLFPDREQKLSGLQTVRFFVL